MMKTSCQPLNKLQELRDSFAMKPRLVTYRSAVSLSLIAALTGCFQSAPKVVDTVGVRTPEKVVIQSAGVPMPSGVDMVRLRGIDEGQALRVYSDLVGIGEADGSKVELRFPKSRAGKVGTGKQLNERFVAMVNESQRFEVFDDEATGLRDASEIVVEGMVVYAGQRWDELLGQRKAITTVRLSVRIVDKATGELIPPAFRTIEGIYGEQAGEGTLLAKGRSLTDPAVVDSLMSDLDQALEDALRSAVVQLELRMRPIGKVIAARDGSVGLFGGERHGLVAGDRMVVFRPEITTIGEKEVIGLSEPIAVVGCDSVAVESTQCTTLRLAPGKAVQVGDYAVLSDESTARRLDK